MENKINDKYRIQQFLRQWIGLSRAHHVTEGPKKSGASIGGRDPKFAYKTFLDHIHSVTVGCDTPHLLVSFMKGLA